MTNITGQFEYNSLSLLNSSVWRSAGDITSTHSFDHLNGRLTSFNLGGEESAVHYNIDGLVTKIGNLSVDYSSDGTVKSVDDRRYTTNEIGWIIERGRRLSSL